MQRTAVAETHAAIAGGEARRRVPTHSCVLCIGVGRTQSEGNEAVVPHRTAATPILDGPALQRLGPLSLRPRSDA